MRARHGFASFIGPDIEHFIAHKRSAGRRFEVEEKTLRLLDDFLLERQVCALDAVTPALIDEFLASRPRSKPRWDGAGSMGSTRHSRTAGSLTRRP